MPSGPVYPKADVRGGEGKKGRQRNRERNTGLIYDASWITIKRYFTFLGDTPPSNRLPRGAILKRAEKRNNNPVGGSGERE